jgi:hypothetical protein
VKLLIFYDMLIIDLIINKKRCFSSAFCYDALIK